MNGVRARPRRPQRALSLALVTPLLACSRDATTTANAAHDGAPAVESAPARVGLGEIMVQIGRRFEVAGRAAVANRFELAEFEAGEIEEAFEGDVPHAELPKEGPTAHIPAMAQAFLKTNLPALKKAAHSRDPKAFEVAFKETAAACNSCHQVSAKGFIEIPTTPGKGVPVLEGEAAPEAKRVDAVVTHLQVRSVPIPGATAPVSLDYIACEARADGARVWVPAGGTGSVDVFDASSGAFRSVEGWKTAERDHDGDKRLVGPSSVAIGDAYAYVGNRAVNEVCAVDLKTLTRGACQSTRAAVDGVAWVRATHQVWATTPSEGSVAVFDAASDGTLKVTGVVRVGGEPEGYAVDESRGLFFTNLEDKGKTVVVDVTKREVRATWDNKCGPDGPRGIAVDSAANLVMVACTDHIQVLDGNHDGALLASLEAGAGVDNIDYVSARQSLYVASGKSARLTVLHVGPRGELTITAQADTRPGARNAVADAAGNVYVADPKGASLLVASPAAP